MKTLKYTVGDLHNGDLQSFTSLKKAEKCLKNLIDEGNEINQSFSAEYEDQGLPVPDANDFYFLYTS